LTPSAHAVTVDIGFCPSLCLEADILLKKDRLSTIKWLMSKNINMTGKLFHYWAAAYNDVSALIDNLVSDE